MEFSTQTLHRASVSSRRLRALRPQRRWWLLAVAALLATKLVAQDGGLGSDALRRGFADPPGNCRIMMRWWWFGPAVAKPEIQRELEQMKTEGIGGVEIANVYPLALDDPLSGFYNQPYLSDEHIEMLRYAVSAARALGLRVDITLGSGWPLGGPHIPVTEAAGMLRVESVKVPQGASSIPLPDISTGEKLLEAFPVQGGLSGLSLGDARPIEHLVAAETRDGRLRLPEDLSGEQTIVFFIASRTGMMVKRPSVGAAGFVLDHYDRNATDRHLQAVGDRLLQAFDGRPPDAVFSDSLEDYGSNWTTDFLQEFRSLRGYDLEPYLPALIGDIGPKTAAVRHDWGRTLTDLANQNFLEPVHSWARDHRTLFRSQTYGYPPVTLSSNRYADLPEGEGKSDLAMWRHFSDTRWAASAGHLFGDPVISSETWTWLHSPAFRATPLDMKAEADLHFLQGINQLVGHGWPYSPESAGEPGWRMYAAGALNAHNPWSFVMPDVAKYLQRVSFALRQGKPANDVALLLPNDDVWATFKSSAHSADSVTTGLGFNTAGTDFSMDESLGPRIGENVIGQILDSGLNLDFIDADAIDDVGISYPVLILPGVERIPVATYRKIEAYARRGGTVIATRRMPSTAPGLMDADKESLEIQQISERLFQATGAPGRFVTDESELGAVLTQAIKPDVRFSTGVKTMGFIHRKMPRGDLYFVANTDNRPHRVQAKFRSKYRSAEIWDAMSGNIESGLDGPTVDLDLGPYESRLVYLTDDAVHSGKTLAKQRYAPVQIELNADWTLDFEGRSQSLRLAKLRSWTQEQDLQYFSGRVVYRTSFNLSPQILQTGQPLFLDFGVGTPIEIPSPLGAHSMRAYLDPPVREAAEVYVNGTRAGSVWCPPYAVRIDKFLKPGGNELKIVVGNTAINLLSAQRPPTYRLLKDRYGDLFSPQDMTDLHPLPSGILGKVQIDTNPAP